MIYEYVCDSCALVTDSLVFRRIGEVLDVCECGGLQIRMVSHLQVVPVIQPYFNHSVGQIVTSNKDFEEKLRVGSIEQSERLNLPHNYQPLYPSEARAHAESTAPDTERSDRAFHQINDRRRIFT